jgi:hypothetical protein
MRDGDAPAITKQREAKRSEAGATRDGTRDQRVTWDDVEERAYAATWHPKVATGEITRALAQLRADQIAPEIIVEALEACDDFPKNLVTRARSLSRSGQSSTVNRADPASWQSARYRDVNPRPIRYCPVDGMPLDRRYDGSVACGWCEQADADAIAGEPDPARAQEAFRLIAETLGRRS